MLSRNLPKSLALISMFALGGCQFFGNLHLTGKSRDKQQASELAAGTYGPATQQGRDYLRSNLTGMAIDAFNRGLATGEDPAAAYNGLGVSYARLGRTDLAYRFFKKAVLSDPANPAYVHNLTSLVNSSAFTLNVMAREMPAPVARAEPQSEVRTADRPVRTPQVPGKLHRDGNRQFSLITVTPVREAAATGVHSAAADACSKRAAPRAKQRCGLIPLPKIESRNARSGQTVLSAPIAAVQLPASDAAGAAPAPKGKAKTLDLSGSGQGVRPAAKPAPARSSASTAAT